jgi:hypothetical protein
LTLGWSNRIWFNGEAVALNRLAVATHVRKI